MPPLKLVIHHSKVGIVYLVYYTNFAMEYDDILEKKYYSTRNLME